MPRQPGLIRAALALVLGAAAGPVAALSCAPMTELAAAEGVIDLHLRFECAPYATVDLSYGPLRLTEETGAQGAVHLRLPVLPASAGLSATLAGETWEIELPEGAAPGGFLWIDAGDSQPGLLPVAGFPVPGRILPELALFGTSPAPGHLDWPVTAGNCGQALRARVLRDGWPAPRLIEARLPGCDLAGTRLRLPLPAG
ncbi:hypothetical protein [Mangrovicoccus algicola]|uniref:DUF4402 domain-containing protein n=1 Tax=Mangrovicoccus algicola TaxID=2771008 RepID=A0A8J7CH56_9RHOB|nr:hypothetical protein [Mangrovicoccus algicola]MBE3637875.1 hypothetical protein [Mangrovicoccus algicola]